jgi:hypothetical protein
MDANIVKWQANYRSFRKYTAHRLNLSDPMPEAVEDDIHIFAEQFNCEVYTEFDYNIFQNKYYLKCNKEDFVIIKLTCPEAVEFTVRHYE